MGVGESKHIEFFLTAERKYFESKKSRDNAVIKDFFQKIINGRGSKIDLATVPVPDSHPLKTLTKEEEKSLSTFMDQLTEYTESSKETHKK